MRVLVTGGAGFIGSHLVAALLRDERVSFIRVLDNLSTGLVANLEPHLGRGDVELMQGDIRDFPTCVAATEGMDLVSHQAALGSVPRSIDDPLTTNHVNITGTLHMLRAAQQAGIRRLVYAASSSTYGDHPGLPKVEGITGKPLSPYAVTKLVNELYADVFSRLYGMELIGLRYFNIFGPRQNPAGPYAAVIPIFIESILQGKAPRINGDGETSRDFTYVDNAVQANLQALFTSDKNAINQVYNIACGEQTSLNELFRELARESGTGISPEYGPERKGDVKHSLADISKAKSLLGYEPVTSLKEGLAKTFHWFLDRKNSDGNKISAISGSSA